MALTDGLHWRTGTTYLHDLLACDTEQFAFPTCIQVIYPYTFLRIAASIRRSDRSRSSPS